MKKVTLAGAEYVCPFAESFRPHSQVELDDMIDSLRKYGLQSPILIYFDTDLQAKCILDGLGRLAVASQVENVQIDVKDLGSKSTNEAFELAKVHNDHRRHDDPAAILKRKEERLQRVAEMSAEGTSTRVMATKLGVSKTQILRDQGELVRGDQQVFPEFVNGQDGKKHPSNKRSGDRSQASKTPKSSKRKGQTRDAKSDVSGSEEPETFPAPPHGKLTTFYRNDGVPDMPGVYRPRLMKALDDQEVVLDAYGKSCPPIVGDTFAETKLRQLLAHMRKVANEAERIREAFDELKDCREPHHNFTWADYGSIKDLIDDGRNKFVKAINELRNGVPFAVCPDCNGDRKGCKPCKLTGYWPEYECDVYPDRFPKKEVA